MGKRYFTIEYIDDRDGIQLTMTDPYSSHIEDMFYDGKILRTVNLEEPGQYRIHITLDEEDNVIVHGKEKYIGWTDVDI